MFPGRVGCFFGPPYLFSVNGGGGGWAAIFNQYREMEIEY